MVIAIDGPVAAGKTTAAKRLAAQLQFSLLDTGAIYRSLALHCQHQTIDWADNSQVSDLARTLPIRFQHDGHENRVWLAGEDVTKEIRSSEISQGASIVSALPIVRDALLELQRDLGAEGRVVAEGRDIGTVVFPDAEVKFFLTAIAPVRARRRYEELLQHPKAPRYENVLAELLERDQRDSTRTVAPLKPANDAYVIDSSDLSIEEVAQTILARVESTSRIRLQEPE